MAIEIDAKPTDERETLDMLAREMARIRPAPIHPFGAAKSVSISCGRSIYRRELGSGE